MFFLVRHETKILGGHEKLTSKVSFWKKLSEDVCGVGAYNPR